MVGKRLDRDGLAEPRADADDETDLRLDVEPLRRPERRLLVTCPLASGADDGRARDDDGAGSAVVADRQVLPVRR